MMSNFGDEERQDNYDGASGGTGRSTGLNDQALESLKQIQKESSQVACECNHGLLVETLKQFMFAGKSD